MILQQNKDFKMMFSSFFVIVMIMFVESNPKSCLPCLCSVAPSGGIQADCSSLNLTDVPTSLSVNTSSLTLRHNRLRRLRSGVFKNLSNLQALDVSYNNIEQLEEKAFVGLHKLTKLNLEKNRLNLTSEVYKTNLFNPLVELQILKLSGNSQVDNKTFTYPDTSLSKATSLNQLFIDGLPDRQFGPGFAKLTNLKILLVTGIFGRCNIPLLTNNTFTNVPHLRRLYLNKCNITHIQAGAFSPLRKINDLDLSTNQHLGFKSAGISYYGLQHSTIRRLFLNQINTDFATCVHISTDDVKYLKPTRLKALYVDFNRLELAEPGSLMFLPETLETLSARGNRFTWGKYIFDLATTPSLRKLDLSLQDKSSHLPLQFLQGNQPIQGQNIKMIDEAEDEITVPWDNLVKRLEEENIETLERWGNNVLSERKPREIVENYDNDNHTEELLHSQKPTKHLYQHLKHPLNRVDSYLNRADRIDTQKPGEKFSSEEEQLIQMDIGKKEKHPRFSSAEPLQQLKYMFRFPKNLVIINGSKAKVDTHLGKLRIAPNKIKVIDVSNNLIRSMIGPITGFDHLTHLNLSNNFIEHSSDHFFSSENIIEDINLSSNYLGNTLKNDDNGKIFRNLKKVKHFSLSSNRISVLPYLVFVGLVDAQHLDLSRNEMSELNITVHHMEQLSFLNVSGNQLQWFTSSLMREINYIAQNHELEIDLRQNPVACSCDGLSFLKWMRDTKAEFVDSNHISCRRPNGTIITLGNLKALIWSIQRECEQFIGIVAGSLIGVLSAVGIVVGGIIYRYRWKLRYLFYMARGNYRHQVLQEDDNQFEYDAFVSYADEDRTFVCQDLLEKVEKEANLKLCIHHRDFMLGEPIASNIINAIHKSRKTLIILSRNFLESYWCRYELEMAKMEGIYSGRTVLLLIVLEKVPLADLSRDILYLMKADSYIEYTNDPDGGNVFWRNLIDAIV